MYFTVNGTMVVDVEWQMGAGEVRRRQIHTHGATAAMLASEGEYFHALRDARQKVAIFIIEDLAVGLNAVLQTIKFPAGVADLDASLAQVDADDLTHGETRSEE